MPDPSDNTPAGGAATPATPAAAAAADLPLAGPRCAEFFALNHLPPPASHRALRSWWEAQPWAIRAEAGWDYDRLREALAAFLSASAHAAAAPALDTLEILPGRDKSGAPERHALCLRPGDIVALVGPTGAGKSRLLADIECLAQGDTPTGRVIRINGRAPDPESRFSGEGKIVAQITQNMNFIMDLPVAAFLRLHAESRALPPRETGAAVRRVLESAVGMAGEPFGPETELTQLSGGQSRALMIADAAFLSPKPVILIDEIENAGVDRTRALELFTGQGKIVLLSTHDPLLALSGTSRLVIRNGAVADVIRPTADEQDTRRRLALLDQNLSALRERLRSGGRIGRDAAASLPMTMTS
ncbi:MAG: ATP-binding cassette domain-containing protein [Opitutaceae bacterium]|jgi:ABC-type lipoprotein export system ATPase subunit|nr:ATP-binding cassette domain-containing protein [Opitutaceae bacterium]